jgi:hypothetical protein
MESHSVLFWTLVAAVAIFAWTRHHKRAREKMQGMIDLPMSRPIGDSGSKSKRAGRTVVSAADSRFDSWADDTFPGVPHRRYTKGSMPMDAPQPSDLSMTTFVEYNPLTEYVSDAQVAIEGALKNFKADFLRELPAALAPPAAAAPPGGAAPPVVVP